MISISATEWWVGFGIFSFFAYFIELCVLGKKKNVKDSVGLCGCLTVFIGLINVSRMFVTTNEQGFVQVEK